MVNGCPAAVHLDGMDTDTLCVDLAAGLRQQLEDALAEAYRRGFADGAASRTDLDEDIDQALDDTLPPDPSRFRAASHTVRPAYPSAALFEANRPLSDAEVAQLGHLVSYCYAATVRGESVGAPRRVSATAFAVDMDTTTSRRSDPMAAMDEFEVNLDAWLLDGSPVRTTNRAGAGTAGTRAVSGLGDPALRVSVGYDAVIEIL